MQLKQKICLLGAYGVGKTSLVRRFVHGAFSDKYLATVGVRIDVKDVRVGRCSVTMVIWDIAGGNDESRGTPSYLGGLAGYIIVNDGTRPETCRISQDLNRFVEDIAGPRPHVILLNKADLANEWVLTPEIEASLAESGGLVLRTSAKTGQFVDDAFQRLAEALSTEAGYDHVGA